MTYDWITKTGATRWIGDVNRITEPMSVGIADFIGWEWFPGAVEAGIAEKVAVVLPKLDAVTHRGGLAFPTVSPRLAPLSDLTDRIRD